MDRVEVDGTGGAVVIDHKTGSSKAEADELAEHGQLAVYQLAADHGAFEDLGLRHTAGRHAGPARQGGHEVARSSHSRRCDTDDYPAWAEEMLVAAAERMAGSAFVAAENKHCSHCPVRSSCPLQEDGRLVTGPSEPADGEQAS